jgi:hypothetical protein
MLHNVLVLLKVVLVVKIISRSLFWVICVVSQAMESREIALGTEIIREGDLGDDFFIIQVLHVHGLSLPVSAEIVTKLQLWSLW